MKELIDVHFDEILLVFVLIGAAVLYCFRPDTKDILIGPVVGALLNTLRSKTKNGNGGQPPKG